MPRSTRKKKKGKKRKKKEKKGKKKKSNISLLQTLFATTLLSLTCKFGNVSKSNTFSILFLLKFNSVKDRNPDKLSIISTTFPAVWPNKTNKTKTNKIKQQRLKKIKKNEFSSYSKNKKRQK